MKNFLLILVFSTIFISTAKSQTIEGDYVRQWEFTNSAVLILTLTLKEDHSFIYHYYQTFTPPNPEKNSYGKGTWKLDKTILTFYTDKDVDLDDKFTLNFNKSKARFISKSPRDRSDKLIKTSLRFFESEVIGVKGTEYFKVE